jgi:hypothetical protein
MFQGEPPSTAADWTFLAQAGYVASRLKAIWRGGIFE